MTNLGLFLFIGTFVIYGMVHDYQASEHAFLREQNSCVVQE